jgi:hypothetical protein
MSSGAVGAVIRDYQGHFIAASCKLLPHVAFIAMAEAIAMKEGLMLVNSGGFDYVIAKSDSTEKIEECSGAERWWTEPAAVYADCVDYATTIGDV